MSHRGDPSNFRELWQALDRGGRIRLILLATVFTGFIVYLCWIVTH